MGSMVFAGPGTGPMVGKDATAEESSAVQSKAPKATDDAHAAAAKLRTREEIRREQGKA
jgi:hypothetical protein